MLQRVKRGARSDEHRQETATYPEHEYAGPPMLSRSLWTSPPIGLVLMRLALAVTIAGRRPSAHVGELIAALLLLSGMWTRAVSAVIAVLELWRTLARDGGWVSLLLATIAAALALMGPGSWSVDARLFGWRRIEIPKTRKE